MITRDTMIAETRRWGAGTRVACAALVIPCAALALVAGLSFDGSFDLGAIWRMCAICAAAPALIAAAGMLRQSRPLPAWLTLAVAVVAWAVGVPVLAIKLAAPGSGVAPGGWLTVLGMAVTDAPRELLTIAPPAAATSVLLAGLGSVVWWAAAWSAEAAVRTAAADRVSMVAVLPGAVVLLAGTAAGVPRGSADLLWPAVAFVAAFALLLAAERAVTQRVAARSAGGERSLLASGGRLGLAAGTTVVIGAAALLIVPVLPGLASRPPADPRQLVKPVSHVQPLIDPLGLVSAWLSAPPQLLFTVRTTNSVNLSWLVLNQYDGQQWLSTVNYAPAGLVLPAERGVTTPGRPLVEQVAVLPHANMPGTWLPAAARPDRLSGVAARFDPSSGILVTLEGTSIDGLSYQVTSSIPEPGVRQLANAVPGSGPAVDAERVLPARLPPVVAAYGTNAMAGAGSPYQQMLQLQNRMLHDFRYEPRAAPGQSYGHLSIFVGRHHSGGPGVFATLFAVLARHAGFASRIAVGFLPGHRVGHGLYLVTTADVLIWPEVYFRGLGWVPFYPLPRPGFGKNRAVIRPLGQPKNRTTLNQRITRTQGSGTGARHGKHSPSIKIPRPERPGSAVWVLYLLAGLVVLALCYLVVAATVRLAIRRRWRRGTDPRGRVAGAWQETLSGLTAAGGVALTTLTPDEVVAHAVAVAGSDAQAPSALLAELANAALFSAVEPGTDEADAARLAASSVRRLARRRTSIRAKGVGLLRPYPAGFERPPTRRRAARSTAAR
jgi:hypothetical protein